MTASADQGPSLAALADEIRNLACRYYSLTGKPLGVTGEMAELTAADLLGLRLAVVRTPLFDALQESPRGDIRVQIKGRAVDRLDRYRGRTPSIRCDEGFETVLLVLLDRENLEPLEIFEADRLAVAARLSAPGSKARNERSSLGISQFRSIARRVWPPAAS